jgi:hypothetical protein
VSSSGDSAPAPPSSEPTPVAPVRGGYRAVLRNRKFLTYEGSAILATTGYAVYAISIPWIAYTSSGSFFIVGLVLFLEIGIYALTFLFAPLVDRAADKRLILVLGYPIQAAAAGTLAYTASRGELHFDLLLVLVAVLAIVWDVDWAVFQVAPRALLSKDELFAGQGLSSALGSSVTVSGYAAGAGLILVTGAVGSGYLYAGLLVLATILAAFVPLRGGRSAEPDYSSGFAEGWRYLNSPEGRPLFQLAVMNTFTGFVAAAPALLLTLDANALFPNHGLSYGVLFTAFVVGGAAIGLVLGHYNPRRRVGFVMLSTLSLAAIALFSTGWVPPSVGLGVVAWLLAGVGATGYASSSWTFLWGYVPQNRLARVTSNLYVFQGTAGAAGALVLGWLANGVAPRSLTELVAGFYALAAVGSLVLPAVRRFAF